MKKLLRIMIFIPLCGLLVVLGASLALSLYYSKNFPVNTWINGVYRENAGGGQQRAGRQDTGA